MLENLFLLSSASQCPSQDWCSMLCFFDLRFIPKVGIWNKNRRRMGGDRLKVAIALSIHSKQDTYHFDECHFLFAF